MKRIIVGALLVLYFLKPLVTNLYFLSKGLYPSYLLKSYNMMYNTLLTGFTSENNFKIIVIYLNVALIGIIPGVLLIYFGARFVRRSKAAQKAIAACIEAKTAIDVAALSQEFKLKPKIINKLVTKVKPSSL